jgi:hypothetical protein
MSPPARDPKQRLQDTLNRLEHDVDCWVASAGPSSGIPYLVPLSFLWDGASLLIATASSTPTSRNMQETGRVRLGIGPTRDVIIVEGSVRVVADGEVTDEVGEAFAAKTGFDPRDFAGYAYFRIQPDRIQAWREANELKGRDLMLNGSWNVKGR